MPIARKRGTDIDRIIEVEFGGNLAIANQVLKPGGTIAAYGSAAVPTPQLAFYPLMFNHTTLQMLLYVPHCQPAAASSAMLLSQCRAETRCQTSNARSAVTMPSTSLSVL
jgi:NADPH2:quinone reductase